MNAQIDVVTAALRMNRDGIVFWKDLVENLRISMNSLRDTLELDGDISIGDSASGEVHCRLDVELYAAVPKSMFLNLFYRPGARVIRHYPQVGEPSELPFCLENNELVLVVNGRSCNPEQAAEYLLREMIRVVKPDALLDN